jgi:predicted  nucleic acid-binding Zn-ribbon protein
MNIKSIEQQIRSLQEQRDNCHDWDQQKQLNHQIGWLQMQLLDLMDEEE